MVISALDERIIEKLRGLDDAQKQRVLDFMEQEFNEPGDLPRLSLGEWLKETDALFEELRQKYGDNHFDIVATLNDIREEASWLRS